MWAPRLSITRGGLGVRFLPELCQVRTGCLVIITLCVLVSALHWLRPVLVPLVVAVALQNVLAPVVDLLVYRGRFPRALAVASSLLVGLGVLALLGSVVVSSIRELTRRKNMRMYQNTLEALLRRASHLFDGLREGADGGDPLQDLPIADAVVETTKTLVNEAMGLLEMSFLVLLFTIYLMQGYQPLRPPRKGIGGRIEARLKRYLVIKTILSLVIGLLVGLILLALNAPLVGMWTFLNFALNFIPNLGPAIATLLPVPLMLFSHGGFSIMLAIALPSLVHVVLGGLLEPKLMGDHMELHPITVMLGLIFWGALWGLPGMFMSAPLTAAFKIVFESIEVTAPFARVLSGNIDSFMDARLASEEDVLPRSH